MRVAHVTPYYIPESEFGGPPASVHELCCALQCSGVDVHVITTTGRDNAGASVVDGVRVTRVRRRTSLGFMAPLDDVLDEALLAADACHVHALFNWPAWRGAARARRFGRPVVVSPRGMLEPAALAHHRFRKRLAWHLMDRRVVASASAIVAATPEEGRTVTQLGLTPTVLPNGIHIPDPMPARGSFRIARGIAPDSPVITFLGRLHPIKRLDVLADAFLAVTSRHGSAQLVLAGPDEASLWPGLQQRLTATPDRVHWIGPLSAAAKWQVLADSDVLVLCSDSESYGRVVAEALAAGVPPVVTTTCPWSVLEREQIGQWVPQSSPAIAAAIDALLSDDTRRRAMGARGRAYARAELGWPRIVPRFVDLYASLTGT